MQQNRGIFSEKSFNASLLEAQKGDEKAQSVLFGMFTHYSKIYNNPESSVSDRKNADNFLKLAQSSCRVAADAEPVNNIAKVIYARLLCTLFGGKRKLQEDINILKYLQPAVDSDDAGALYVMGMYYEKGLQEPVNLTLANEYYRKATEKNYPEAKACRGRVCFLQGEEAWNKNIKNKNEVYKFFMDAVMFNPEDAQAHYKLALCYLDIFYILEKARIKKEYTPKLFKTHLLKAAELGYAEAQYQLGLLYEKGDEKKGIPRSESDAMLWFRSAEKQSHIPAKTALKKLAELCYKAGRYEISENRQTFKGINIIIRAAEPDKGNNVEAQLYLAQHFENYITASNEKHTAKFWYQAAADNGDLTAKMWLADHFAKESVKDAKDTKSIDFEKAKKAFDLYKAVADHSSAHPMKAIAQYHVGRYFESGIAVAQSSSQAEKYYDLSAKQGNAAAQNKMGEFYEKSLISDIKKDDFVLHTYRKKAVEYYEKAANQNDKDAQYNLGICYQKGIGVKQDFKKAEELFRKAAKQKHVKAQHQVYLYDTYGSVDVRKILAELRKKANTEDLVDPEAQYQYANYLKVLGKYTKALEFYKKVQSYHHTGADFTLACFEYNQEFYKTQYSSPVPVGWYFFGGPYAKYLNSLTPIQRKGRRNNHLGYYYEFLDKHNPYSLTEALKFYYEAEITSNETCGLEREATNARSALQEVQHNITRVHKKLADQYTEKDNSPEAVNYYHRVIDAKNVTPENQAEYGYRLGLHYEQKASYYEKIDISGWLNYSKKSLKYYRMAVEAGHIHAKIKLNKLIEALRTKGFELAFNKNTIKQIEGINYLKVVADPESGNDPQAQFYMGLYYEQEAADEVLHWYDLAASPLKGSGYPDAQIKVADYHANLTYDKKLHDKKALEFYQKAAEQGHSVAIYRLGEFYETGRAGLAINLVKAEEYYRKSAHSDHPHKAAAQNKLGEFYEQGKGDCKQDLKQAIHYFKLAAKKNPAAQNNLGRCYEYGISVSSYLNIAFNYYKKAADQKDAEGQYNVARCYHNAIGVKKDSEKALQTYILAAEQGHTKAQYRCAVYYENEAVPPDQKKAFFYYESAAHKGHADAQYHLAQCYEKGRLGIPINIKKAAKLFEAAVNQDDLSADSQHGLAERYEKGSDAVTKDEKTALRLYCLAADKGHTEALSYLAKRYETAEGIEKDNLKIYASAFRLKQPVAIVRTAEKELVDAKEIFNQAEAFKKFVSAAEKGHPEAQYIAGLHYANGVGVKQNDEKAVIYFQKAAKQKHAKAQYELAFCFKDGKGIKKDKKGAFELFIAAAKQGDVSAQIETGVCHSHGIGTPKNIAEGIEIFKRGGFLHNLHSVGNLIYEKVEKKIANKTCEMADIEDLQVVADAKMGDYPKAQWLMGQLHETGFSCANRNGSSIHLTPSEEKAIYFYQLAANQQDSDAQNSLALLYLYGKKELQNPVEALKLLQLAERQGNIKAYYNLGRLYQEGREEAGIKKDLSRAADYYKLCKSRRNLPASEYLPAYSKFGECLEEQGRKEFAYQHYIEGAERGDTPSLYHVGRCYKESIGIKPDVKQAKAYFSKAADKGHDKAQAEISLFNKYDMEGYKKLYELRKTAEASEIDAQFEYAQLLEATKNKSNIQEARKWYEKANLKNHLGADFALARMQSDKDINEFVTFLSQLKEDEKPSIDKRSTFIAYAYEMGEGVRQDLQKAVDYYAQAQTHLSSAQSQEVAENIYGHQIRANVKLAAIRANEGRFADAEKCYLFAADTKLSGLENMDQAEAHYQLGLLYESGKESKIESQTIEKNELKALIYFQKTMNVVTRLDRDILRSEKAKTKLDALMNSFRSQWQRLVFERSVATTQEKKEGIVCLHKLADEAHNAEAQFYLGQCYMTGNGVIKDDNKAFYYYKSAAAQSYPKALYELGCCYQDGTGVASDQKTAFSYFLDAMRRSHPEATYQVARSYEDGIGTPKNMQEAIKYYQLAAERNHLPSEGHYIRCHLQEQSGNTTDSKLAKIYHDVAQAYKAGKKKDFDIFILITRKDIPKAIYFYGLAADLGHADAQYQLALYLAAGKDVSRDLEKAVELFRKAATQQHPDAIKALEKLIQQSQEEGYKNILKENKEAKAQGIEALKTAAQSGHIKAQFELAQCYEKGNGVQKNVEEAIKWYRKVADAHGIEIYQDEARVKMGNYYAQLLPTSESQDADGSKQMNDREAFTYYEIASQRNAVAAYLYAQCHEMGISVSVNLLMAEKGYKKASDLGNANADNRLGLLYEMRKLNFTGSMSVFSNNDPVFYYYDRAASQGHADAQYNLGRYYEDNPSYSFQWYETAARQNHPEAQNSLGKCYLQGNGVKQNLSKAIEWFTKAASQEVADAKYNLAECYRKGQGVEQDLATAIELYKEASIQKHIKSIHYLIDCYEQGNGVKKDEKEAIKYLQLAAQQNDPDAQNKLALYLVNGKNIAKDVQAARQLWEQAAQKEHPDALYQLGHLYEEGLLDDVKKDSQKSMEYYKRAAEKGHAIAQFKMGEHFEKEGNYNLAFAFYQKAAAQGDIDGLYHLGKFYQHRKAVQIDVKAALACFEKVKIKREEHLELDYRIARCQQDLGNYTTAFSGYSSIVKRFELEGEDFKKDYLNIKVYVVALNSLGLCHQNGKGTEKNEVRAGNLYLKAKKIADKEDFENAELLYNLGFCHEHGICKMLKDEKQAFKYYELASNKGEPNAKFRLASFYEKGLGGVTPDEEKAAQLYQQAANHHHAEALCKIALRLEAKLASSPNKDKAHSEKDQKLAVHNYQLAAKSGDKHAFYQLGVCYTHGKGVKKDLKEAFKHYSEAAEAGLASAQNALGVCYREGHGISKNGKEAEKWFRKAADQQYPEAEFNLAVLYQYGGKEISKDLNKAFSLYHVILSRPGHAKISEAEKNLSICHEALGYEKMAKRYEIGQGVPKDDVRTLALLELAVEKEKTASAMCKLASYYERNKSDQKYHSEMNQEIFKLYEKAANKENPEAQYHLGRFYEYGLTDDIKKLSEEKRLKKALELYSKASKHAYGEATNRLADWYNSGKYIKQIVKPEIIILERDSEKARQLYRLAAEQGVKKAEFYRVSAEKGNSEAQYVLGVCYANAIGVDKDEKVAADWYIKAAEQKHMRAQNNLGSCYRYGRGVVQDYKQALEYYTHSAEQKNASAQYNLAVCYENGIGIEKNQLEALNYYRLASDQGVPEASFSLGMYHEEINEELQAVNYYRSAADKGNTDAICSLGRCYETGIGVVKNEAEALKYYRLAAEKGNSLGQYYLGDAYENGMGVKQDLAEAMKWYRLSAAQGHKDAAESLAELTSEKTNIHSLQTLQKEEIKAVMPRIEVPVSTATASRFFSPEPQSTPLTGSLPPKSYSDSAAVPSGGVS